MDIKSKDGKWKKEDYDDSEKSFSFLYDHRTAGYQDIIRETLKRLQAEMERNKILSRFVSDKLPRSVSDSIAQEEISHILIRRKGRGITKINILNLMEETRLPPDQIHRVMSKLKDNGVEETNDD